MLDISHIINQYPAKVKITLFIDVVDIKDKKNRNIHAFQMHYYLNSYFSDLGSDSHLIVIRVVGAGG